jgi:hypothetical protein
MIIQLLLQLLLWRKNSQILNHLNQSEIKLLRYLHSMYLILSNIDHPSQPQKEETPFSPPIIENVPNSSKQSSKLDEIAEKYWPLMLIAVSVCLGLMM